MHEDSSPTPPGGFPSTTARFNGPRGDAPETSLDPFAGLFRDAPDTPGRPPGYDPDPSPAQGFGPAGPGQPGYPGGGQFQQEAPQPSRTRTIVIVTAVIVLLIGGGVGAWTSLGSKGSPPGQTSGSPSTSPAASSSSLKPSTGATTPAGGGLIAVAPGVASNGTETSVLSFLNTYFTAINDYNFQAYHALLDAKMQRAETEPQFHQGYRSVHDSDIVLTRIASGGGQAIAASMTFTSHQPVSNSPSHSTCTYWNTTLYLTPQASSYAIGQPPSNYHAAYRAC